MRPALLILVLVAAACRGESGSSGPSPDAAADAPAGVGCTATAPRSEAPETFVGPTGLQDRLTALIDSTQTSLDLQIYLFTVKPLADRIVAAKQRGVAVRVILDPDEAGNAAVKPILDDGGVTWHNASAIYPFAHAKYMILDGKQAVIMSMNFNIDAMNNERNYGLVDRDPDDIADLQAIFGQDWALATGASPAPADLSCTRLVVSPANAAQRILELVNGSTATLDVEVQYITDVNVRNAIGAAAKRGVAVRVILASPDDQPANQDLTTFFKNDGIPVKYAGNQFYPHAKLLVADGVAFVGSQNMSPTALNDNREVGALVFEPSAVPTIQQQFDADWAATTPAP